MRIKSDAIKDLCRQWGWTLNDLLKKAGVSRTAYYALTRKDNILPKSIQCIAKEMNVSPSEILLDTDKEIREMRELYEKAQVVSRQYPKVNIENVMHTFLMLKKTPLERLRKGLLRGKTTHFYR